MKYRHSRVLTTTAKTEQLSYQDSDPKLYPATKQPSVTMNVHQNQILQMKATRKFRVRMIDGFSLEHAWANLHFMVEDKHL